MKKIIVATHGYLADGIKSSLEILGGSKNDISFINAYVDSVDLNSKIQEIFKEIEEDDEVVIFTDIYGGSVNQMFVPYCLKDKNKHLISGFNLAIILEVALSDEAITNEYLNAQIERCREQLIYVNEIKKLYEEDLKEDDFF